MQLKLIYKLIIIIRGSLFFDIYKLNKMRGNTMRIVVVGDEGVGKTSLICAMISDLLSQIPKTHKKVVLPPDMCAYSKDVFTQIIDTSRQNNIANEIKSCDLVLLVYDISNQQSIRGLKENWLPIIHQFSKEIPVVIVGNKKDKFQLLVDQQQEYTPVKDVLRNLVKSYKQVQMGLECSAYYDQNVKMVLNSAQRAILYPIGPLYDLTEKKITKKFHKALLRIFRILDKEMRGNLVDDDLIGLQERVFQSELSSQDIRAIKNIIQQQCQQEQNNSISINGFIAFQSKCIEMLKIQICWSILRHFDYDNSLDIFNSSDSFVIDYDAGQSLELSSNVINFLNKIYEFAHKITPHGENPMQKLFEPSPSVPLAQFLQKQISLERFILLWHLFSMINYKQCYRALLYIGYDCRLDECFVMTRGKKSYSDLQKLKDRKLYSILFVDDKEHSSFINIFFQNSIQKGVITRDAILFSSESTSKIILLFKIRPHHLKEFILEEELAKRLDMIVYFSNQRATIQRKDLNIAPHIMLKEITQEIAEKKIQLYQMPELNLKSIPIKLQKSSNDRLMNYLIGLFDKFQEGYSAQFIQKLKKQSNKMRNIFLGVASAVGIAAVGLLTLGKRFK